MEGLQELITEVRGLRLAFERVHEETKPLTREQAAEYLNVHRDTLWKWAKEGQITYSKLGDGERASMRFFRDDLDEFARNRRKVVSIDHARQTRRNVS